MYEHYQWQPESVKSEIRSVLGPKDACFRQGKSHLGSDYPWAVSSQKEWHKFRLGAATNGPEFGPILGELLDRC
jgi:hypothetical protein